MTKPELESASPPLHPNLEGIRASSARQPSIPPITPSVDSHRVDIIGSNILHLRKNMTTPTSTPALLSLRTKKTCLTSSLGEHLGQVSLSPGPYPTLQQYPGPHQPRQSFAPHAVQATAAPPGHRGCVLRPPPLALPARDAETCAPLPPLGELAPPPPLPLQFLPPAPSSAGPAPGPRSSARALGPERSAAGPPQPAPARRICCRHQAS